MKLKFALTTLAFGLAAAPALAGDMITVGPGVKYAPHGVAVPVPAPYPVPDVTGPWYMSLGAGYTFASSGDITAEGPRFGHFSSFGSAADFESFSFAAGRKFWGNWRGEFDFTFRPKQKISRERGQNYTARTAPVEAESVTVVQGTESLTTRSWDISSYSVDRTEQSDTANQTFMLNVFYDIPTRMALRPYVGAGLGLVARQTRRSYKENGDCTGTIQTITNPFSGVVESWDRPVCTGPQTISGEGAKQSIGYGFAGALMTGLIYEIKPGLEFDLGYRYLLQSASASLDATSAAGTSSTIRFEDRGDHEVRATVRMYID